MERNDAQILVKVKFIIDNSTIDESLFTLNFTLDFLTVWRKGDFEQTRQHAIKSHSPRNCGISPNMSINLLPHTLQNKKPWMENN